MNDAAKDAVDKAIASTGPDSIDMFSVPVQIASTGRPCQIAVPADATDAEMLEIIAWMASSLAAAVRARREGPKSRLVIARGSVKGMD